MFRNFKRVLRELMCDAGGLLSWGRVASSVNLVASIIWISHVIWTTGGIPSLEGIIAFVLAPYGVNKATSAIQAFSDNPVGKDPNKGE